MSAGVTKSPCKSISLGTFKVADSTVCTAGGTRPGVCVCCSLCWAIVTEAMQLV